MDAPKCPDCREERIDTDGGYDTVTVRCPTHIVALIEKLRRHCADESPWTLARHKRANPSDTQMNEQLDRMIRAKRWEMGLAPREEYGAHDYGMAHPG